MIRRCERFPERARPVSEARCMNALGVDMVWRAAAAHLGLAAD
jgi:hypothetical protein